MTVKEICCSIKQEPASGEPPHRVTPGGLRWWGVLPPQARQLDQHPGSLALRPVHLTCSLTSLPGSSFPEFPPGGALHWWRLSHQPNPECILQSPKVTSQLSSCTSTLFTDLPFLPHHGLSLCTPSLSKVCSKRPPRKVAWPGCP